MHVVQPGTGRERDGIVVVEAGVHVTEVARVGAGLDAWMGHLADGPTEIRLHALIEVAIADLGPLLEFHEHRRIGPDRRFPEDERVEPSGAQRQLHLEDDAVVSHVRIPQLRSER